MSDREFSEPCRGERRAPPSHCAGLGRRSAPITDRHLSKLAIVYVRQSSPQQIFEHQESRAPNMRWPIMPPRWVGPASASW